MTPKELSDHFHGRRFRAEWAPSYRTDKKRGLHSEPIIWVQERTDWNASRGNVATPLETAAAFSAGLPREVPTRYCEIADEQTPDYSQPPVFWD